MRVWLTLGLVTDEPEDDDDVPPDLRFTVLPPLADDGVNGC